MSDVQTNMKESTFMVSPQAKASLSPRALWEAVEKAKEKPIRLVGPSGTFTSKPQS